jgi:hypothetical protein
MLVWMIGLILLSLSLSFVLVSLVRGGKKYPSELEHFDFELNKITEKKYCA